MLRTKSICVHLGPSVVQLLLSGSLSRLVLTALLTLVCGPLFAQKGADLESELPPDAHHLKIGDAAPDFSLRGVDGKIYTLADFKDAPFLMVVFLSNHCPYSHAAETRLLSFASEMKTRGLAVVAINPNSPEGVRIDELGYSKYSDSYEDMKLYAKEQGFTFPYLYDGETQATAKAYGCLATPHVFVFDQKRQLRYMGRFDDSRFADAKTVTSSDARKALNDLLAGRPVAVAVTKPMGCSTKWLWKKAEIIQADEQWKSAPVSVEPIDAAGVAALARNGTQKLRLVNVWATWCIPCVHEFPGFVSISRRLSNRDFEVITISVDDPINEAKVKEFLEKQHVAIPNRVKRSLRSEGRTGNNFLFTGANTEALMKALDPESPGPVPYTVVIEPGGKVVYRRSGEVNFAELQSKILDRLGPYYKP
jgi:peroxiredoxin